MRGRPEARRGHLAMPAGPAGRPDPTASTNSAATPPPHYPATPPPTLRLNHPRYSRLHHPRCPPCTPRPAPEGSQMSGSMPLRMPKNLSKCGAMAGCPLISCAYVGDTVVLTSAVSTAYRGKWAVGRGRGQGEGQVGKTSAAWARRCRWWKVARGRRLRYRRLLAPPSQPIPGLSSPPAGPPIAHPIRSGPTPRTLPIRSAP